MVVFHPDLCRAHEAVPVLRGITFDVQDVVEDTDDVQRADFVIALTGGQSSHTAGVHW